MNTYTQPGVPNVADYVTFLQNEAQIPALALPYALGAPAAATLSAGTGGSLPAGPVYVRLTYLSVYGEGLPSVETSVTVAASGAVVVTSPARVTNSVSYNVYASDASGTETLQNTTPITIGTNYTLDSLTTSGVSVPTADASASPWITWAFNRAYALVQNFPGYVDQNDYTNVVYNCATHIQIEITPDQAGQNFFATLTGGTDGGFNLAGNIVGQLSSSADQGTSQSMVVPEAMHRLTFQDLQFAKTPYGRVFLGWGQDIGPVWGVT